MTDEIAIPVIAEEARVLKHRVETERVSVRTVPATEQVVLHEEVLRDTIEVTRVSVDREVAEAPPVRTEGDVTIVPVLEERVVVEKRLFVVEELHLRRRTTREPVDIPVTLRRTRIEVDRETFDQADNQTGEP